MESCYLTIMIAIFFLPETVSVTCCYFPPLKTLFAYFNNNRMSICHMNNVKRLEEDALRCASLKVQGR